MYLFINKNYSKKFSLPVVSNNVHSFGLETYWIRVVWCFRGTWVLLSKYCANKIHILRNIHININIII